MWLLCYYGDVLYINFAFWSVSKFLSKEEMRPAKALLYIVSLRLTSQFELANEPKTGWTKVNIWTPGMPKMDTIWKMVRVLEVLNKQQNARCVDPCTQT